jgi:hypothetical protein
MSDRLFSHRREAGRFLAGLLDKNRGLNDETRAVEPLERTARWESGEVPKAYPIPCEDSHRRVDHGSEAE